MILKIQIIGFILSFAYGFFFSLLISLNHKMIYSLKKTLKIISSITIIIIGVLLYFLLLKNIIEGLFHVYFVFALLIGACIENFLSDKVANRIKK